MIQNQSWNKDILNKMIHSKEWDLWNNYINIERYTKGFNNANCIQKNKENKNSDLLVIDWFNFRKQRLSNGKNMEMYRRQEIQIKEISSIKFKALNTTWSCLETKIRTLLPKWFSGSASIALANGIQVNLNFGIRYGVKKTEKSPWWLLFLFRWHNWIQSFQKK